MHGHSHVHWRAANWAAWIGHVQGQVARLDAVQLGLGFICFWVSISGPQNDEDRPLMGPNLDLNGP